MIFPLFVQKTPVNFGGPRAGSQCQELFANLPKFSTIIFPVAQTCLICDNLHHTCKKDLTRDPVAGIMARAPYRFCTSVWHWRRKTCYIVGNLVHTRKKDLTIVAFARILAQATPNASSSHYYWRPRAKIPEKSSDFVENVSRGTFPNQYLQKSLDSFLLIVVVYNVPILPDYLFLQ